MGDVKSIRNRVQGLQYLKPAELRPNPRNWRKHPERQSATLKGILSEVGIAGALLAYKSERNGGALTLIDGHLRTETADAEWPVLILDVTDAEADLLLASYDPLSTLAEPDNGALAKLLADLRPEGEALAQMLAELAPPNKLDRDPDEIPEPPTITRAKPGDVWILGRHRLACGSSLDLDTVLKARGGCAPRVAVTDPPFEMAGIDQAKALTLGGVRVAVVLGGNRWIELTRLAGWTHKWDAVLIYTNHRSLPTAGMLCTQHSRVIALEAADIESHGTAVALTREKEATGFSSERFASYAGSRSSVLVVESLRKPHPHSKPAWVFESFVAGFPGDDTIYEPFSGGGTCLIACELLGKHCVAIELDPQWVDVSMLRWEQFTGQKAELEK